MNVSVIIPVYNAEKYIREAIQSCLDLDEVKEIIVVDDGYPDNAYHMVLDWSKTEPKIKLFTHPNHENKGAGASRNLGIQKATQEYIAFLDADDFFLPNRFEKDKEVFNTIKEVDGVYNAIGCYFYNERSKEVFNATFPSELTTVNKNAKPNAKNLFEGLIGLKKGFGYFSIIGLTVKRDFLNNQKIFFSESSMHEDTEFIFKLAYYGNVEPSEIEKPVTLRGVHQENRITENNKNLEKKYTNRIKYLNSLIKWAKEEKLEKEYLHLFQARKIYFRFLLKNKYTKISLLKAAFNNLAFFKSGYYIKLHKEIFKNSAASRVILKLRKSI